MDITWFKVKKGGMASLYATNITLNVEASSAFSNAAAVLVGMNGGKLVLKPLKKAEAERGDLDGAAVYKIAIHSSYARVSSTELMKEVTARSGITLSGSPRKFPAEYDEKDGVLLIDLLQEKED